MSLSLRVKSSITAISVIALSFVVLLIHFGEENRKAELKKENKNLHQTVDEQIAYLEHDLNLIDRDMSFLASEPELQNILVAQKINNSKNISIYTNTLNTLRSEYARYLDAKEKYLKLEIYGKDNGWVNIASINRRVDENYLSGNTGSVKEKNKYPYFTEAESLSSKPDEIKDIIRWDAASYNNRKLIILSITRPVYNKTGSLLGVIVLSINFTNQINRILNILHAGDHFILGFSSGDYILHLFNIYKKGNEHETSHYHLAEVNYNELGEFILKDIVQDDKDKNIDDFLLYHNVIKLDCGNTLYLYMGRNKGGLLKPYYLVLYGSWYAYLALFLLISWLGVLLSWLPLRQLNKVSEVVERISSGTATNKDLPVSLKNEIGDLSRAFNGLLVKLEESESEVVAGKEQLELALKGAAIGIWDWNIVTNEIYLSPRWKEMLGYRDDEIENSVDSMNKLFHPDDKFDKWNKINAYLDGSSDKYENEFRMRHKDGHYVDILSRAFVVRDKDNKPVRLVGMHSDITARKQQEEKRIQYEKEQKEALVREVHHRIKNNLQGVASLLRQHVLRDPEIKEHLDSAISQVYTMAKVHGLQGSNIYEAISLSKMVEEIADMTSNYSGTDIEYSELNGCKDIMLHEKESVPVALIINELIMNSCKHRRVGTIPSVALECEGNDGEGIVVIVKNDIDTTQQEAVSEKKDEGSGLDLVRSLLPPHGAKIEVNKTDNVYITKLEFREPIIYQAKGNMTSKY